MRIILIGMPGCGKTTIGKKVAMNLNLKFVDADEYIEEKYKMSISRLFATVNESGFRKLENEALKEMILQDDIVLSTGGGLPCFYNNIKILKDSGTVIYIKLPVKMLFHRLKNAKKTRPLTANKSDEEILEYLDKTLSEREKFYNQANYIVDGANTNLTKFISTLYT